LHLREPCENSYKLKARDFKTLYNNTPDAEPERLIASKHPESKIIADK
jgi:hypothetical protein